MPVEPNDFITPSQGIAFTYENLVKAISEIEKAQGQPLRYEPEDHLQLQEHPAIKRHKFLLVGNTIYCHPKDRQTILEAGFRAILQLHRERYGISDTAVVYDTNIIRRIARKFWRLHGVHKRSTTTS